MFSRRINIRKNMKKLNRLVRLFMILEMNIYFMQFHLKLNKSIFHQYSYQ